MEMDASEMRSSAISWAEHLRCLVKLLRYIDFLKMEQSLVDDLHVMLP